MKRLAFLAVVALAGCARDPGPPIGKMVDTMEQRQATQMRSLDEYQARELAAIAARAPGYISLCRATMPQTPPRSAAQREERIQAVTACGQQHVRADSERLAAEMERRAAAIDRETDRAAASIQRQQDAIDLARMTAPTIPASIICNRFGTTTVCN